MGHQHDPLILNHLGIGDVDIFSLRLVSFDEDICFRVAWITFLILSGVKGVHEVMGGKYPP